MSRKKIERAKINGKELFMCKYDRNTVEKQKNVNKLLR